MQTPANYVAALMRIQPFTVHEISGDVLKPYMTVSGETLIPAVTISEHDLAGQAERVSAEIAWWSRLHAQAERVVHFSEREFAIWKSTHRLEHAGDILPATGKKPTAAQAEDLYRTDPEYRVQNERIEAAKEAMSSCKGVLDAFKAKREMLARELFRANDGSLRRIAG